jgi:hypothetical protein
VNDELWLKMVMCGEFKKSVVPYFKLVFRRTTTNVNWFVL